MLITDIPSVVTYTYTGVDNYPIPFPFYGLSTVTAGYRTSTDPTDTTPYIQLTYGVDFTVTGVKAGNNDSDLAYVNGELTLTDAGKAKLVLGYALVVSRATPIEQQYSYNELDNFPAKSHENALGHLAVICQELKESVGRSLKAPIGSDEAGDDFLNEILQTADEAKKAAEEAKESAEDAKEAADSITPENFVAITNTNWAYNAIGLPEYGAVDSLKEVRVNEDGSALELYTRPDDPDVVAGGGGDIRNLILDGRRVNGQPAFLATHTPLDTYHTPTKFKGKAGVITGNTSYDTSSTAERLMSNQKAYSGNVFQSGNPTPDPTIVDYEFKEPILLTAVELLVSNTTQYPTSVEVFGQKEGETTWSTLYVNQNWKPAISDYGTNIDKRFSTMIWMLNNTQYWKSIRIQMRPINTATRIRVTKAQFYEAPVTNLDKFDAILCASPLEPFKASIARGHTGDQSVVIERPITISGDLLAEQSRNYIYLVPELADGSCPTYVNEAYAVHIPEAHAYLVRDLRRISYESLDALEKQTVFCYQSNNTVQLPANARFELGCKFGGRALNIVGNYLQAELGQTHRGALGPLVWSNAANSYIQQENSRTANEDPSTDVGVSNGIEWTFECDLKFTGSTDVDTYFNIADLGFSNPSGYFITYYAQRKEIAVYGFNDSPQFCIPVNLSDGAWHSFSISYSASRKLFMHIDGKCLGFFDNVDLLTRAAYQFWMVGGLITARRNSWIGNIDNVRYTLGQCRYQQNDYIVPAIFSPTVIADDTLWYDSVEGTVKVYQNGQWELAPMLCVGYVDTAEKEHIFTNRPLGQFNTSNLLPEIKAVSDNSSAGANNGAAALFNFYGGGGSAFSTPNGVVNNTNTYFGMMELEMPVETEELRLYATNRTAFHFPCVFTLKLGNDGAVWTTVVDRSTFINDGSVNNSVTDHRGATANYNYLGLKRFPYTYGPSHTFFMIEFLPKGDVPNYAGVATGARMKLILKGAKPEIQKAVSYNIGPILEIGPTYIVNGQMYYYDAPFGPGVPLQLTGYTTNMLDYRRRKILIDINTADTGAANGGGVRLGYDNQDKVYAKIANAYVTANDGNGCDFPDSNTASSTYGELYILAKRIK